MGRRGPCVWRSQALALRQTRALAPRSSRQTQVSSWRTGRAAATVCPQWLWGAGLHGTHAERHRKVRDHLRHASVPSPMGLTSNWLNAMSPPQLLPTPAASANVHHGRNCSV